MDFFEKGDPKNNGMPYRFPVTTVNFSKNDKFLLSICQNYYKIGVDREEWFVLSEIKYKRILLKVSGGMWRV